METTSKPTPNDPIQQLIQMNKQLHQRRVDASVIKRCQVFINLLMQDTINLEQLKEECRNGIPDQAHRLRVYCWMVLFGVLPLKGIEWKQTISKLKMEYQMYNQEFFNTKKYTNTPYGERQSKQLQEWNELKQDYYIWQQIQKDTMRTRSQLGFFCGAYDIQQQPFFKTGARKQKEKQIRGESNEQYKAALTTLDHRLYRYDVMTKILFVYSKFNKKLRYVQGMNQILSPIFYLTNLNQQQPHQWECFWIFKKILEDIKELLIKQFDQMEIGIEGKLRSVENKLMVIDYQLWARLKKLQIKPFFYAFKWVTLYFAQQFQLYDLMLLWDNIFTFENRQEYCQFLCIAIMQCKRAYILNNGFSSALSHIQDNSQMNVRDVIRKGRQLYKQYGKVNFAEEAKQLQSTRIKIDKALQAAKYIKDQSVSFVKNIKGFFKR